MFGGGNVVPLDAVAIRCGTSVELPVDDVCEECQNDWI